LYRKVVKNPFIENDPGTFRAPMSGPAEISQRSMPCPREFRGKSGCLQRLPHLDAKTWECVELVQQIPEEERGSVKKRVRETGSALSAVDTRWDRRAAGKRSRANARSCDAGPQPGAAANSLRSRQGSEMAAGSPAPSSCAIC
jgi:hypothetical protein